MLGRMAAELFMATRLNKDRSTPSEETDITKHKLGK
jgi:hypothetical protein